MSDIDKPDWENKNSDRQAEEDQGIFEGNTLEHESAAVQELYTKLREMIDAINPNTAKTGITTSQANAITANTAKTGITTSQANAITANTAKTGITNSQATAITTSTARGNSYYAIQVLNFSNSTNTKVNLLPVKGPFESIRHIIDSTAPFDATIFDTCGFSAPRGGQITRVVWDATAPMQASGKVVFTKWVVAQGGQKASIEGQWTVAMGGKGQAANVGYTMDLEKISADSGNPSIKGEYKYMFGLQFPDAPDDVTVTMEFKFDI